MTKQTLRINLVLLGALCSIGIVCLVAPKPVAALTKPVLLVDSEPLDVLVPIRPTITQPKMPEPAYMPTDVQRLSMYQKQMTLPTATTQTTGCITPDFNQGVSLLVGPNETLQLCPGTYTVPDNFAAYYAVSIWGDHATLDCNGATLIGNYYSQEELPWNHVGVASQYWANDVTIQNCNLQGFGYAIFTGGGYDGTTNQFRQPKQVRVHDNNFSGPNYQNLIVSSAVDSYIFNNQRTTGDETRLSMGPGTIKLESVSDSFVFNNNLQLQTGIAVSFNSTNNEIYKNTLGNLWAYYGPEFEGAIILDRGSAYNHVHDNTMIASAPLARYGFLFLNTDAPYDSFAGTGGAHDNTIDHNVAIDPPMAIQFSGDVHNNIIANNTFGPSHCHQSSLTSWLCNGTVVEWSYIPSARAPYANRIENNIFNYSNDPSEPTDIISVAFYEHSRDNILVGNYFNGKEATAFDGGNNIFDENGVGNYWAGYDDPSDLCMDENKNGICDDSYMIEPSWTIDHYPISGVPIIQPLGPFSVNEPNALTVRLSAWDPNGDKLQYSISDSRFKSMEGCWPGRHSFMWQTDRYSAGSYDFTATVSDGEHVASQSFRVNVNDTCYINKRGQWTCYWPTQAIACY